LGNRVVKTIPAPEPGRVVLKKTNPLALMYPNPTTTITSDNYGCLQLTMRFLRFNFTLFLMGLCSAQAFASNAEPLRFGSVAMDSPVLMQHRLLPLTTYLSRALGRPVILRLSTDMPDAIDALVKGRVDFAYMTPVAYLDAHARGDAHLVVKMATEGRPSFKLMIIVRQNSPIRRVADLAGKRFAFGDRAALLQRAVVVGAGMPLQRLGGYSFLNHYDNVVRGVLVGDYDAGIVIENTAHLWRGRGIRLLYSSQPLPPYNIAASARLPHAALIRLRRALLRVNAAKPEYRPVIKALGQTYTGFAPGKDSDYDIIRKLTMPFRQ